MYHIATLGQKYKYPDYKSTSVFGKADIFLSKALLSIIINFNLPLLERDRLNMKLGLLRNRKRVFMKHREGLQEDINALWWWQGP